jgi:hypothetical protein
MANAQEQALVRTLFRSSPAWDFCNKDGLLSRHSHLCETDSALCDELEKNVSALALIADIDQIDDVLARRLSAHSRERSIPVGIIPYAPAYSARLRDLLKPSTTQTLGKQVGAYDITGSLDKRHDDHQIPPVMVLKDNDVDIVLQQHRWASLAITTAGRQTYCLLGKGCLHPSLEAPPKGVLGAHSLDCDHWMIQSCHSPFVWSDLGTYLSIPLSFLLRSRASTFVCSIRVQTYVPGLLRVYLDNVRSGQAVGDIVVLMNRYCRQLSIDIDPFILFGNPLSRIATTHVAKETIVGGTCQYSPPSRPKLQNVARNLAFLEKEEHFQLKKAAKAGHYLPALVRLNREVQHLLRVYDTQLPQHRAGVSEDSDLDAVAFHLSRSHAHFSLRAPSLRIRKVWEATEGYYYHLGESLDRSYVPLGVSEGDGKCAVCSSVLIRSELSYAGAWPTPDYQQRTRYVCARCLVVSDLSSVYEHSLVTRFTKRNQGCALHVHYVNDTAKPQWVFGFCKATDPQNISANTAKRQYRQLVSKLKLSQKYWEGVTLQPGATQEFALTVTDVPAGVFYFLVEMHVFVDFCWNWLSFNYRATGLHDWVESEIYREVVPRRK